MRFPGLYGNPGLKQRLTAAQRRLSHCYILEGPAGSGKKTLARILAAAMECEGDGDIPCGVCGACRKVFKNEHPDVITVDSDKATVPIRLIRDMQADAYIRPNEGRRKVYILPRAQDMQAPAQNALLKLLEEPPAYCSFLLLTDTTEKLLETVRSRAVELSMAPLSNGDLTDALRQAHPELTLDQLSRAIDRSGGYLGAALDILTEPETELDQTLDTILAALSGEDELQLLSALLPLEKYKRPELLALLAELNQALVRAMDPGAIPSARTLLLSRCTPQRRFDIAQAVKEAITLLQANGSTGHAVGILLGRL